MITVGLTGGIGSGKSTVAQGFVARGAALIDADAIVHELQQPGTEVFAEMVERFGPGIVAPDGSLDRAAVAALVFSDSAALADLNAIVHPPVRREIADRLAACAGTERVVVLDIPLLTERQSRYPISGILVVDVPVETAVQRLIEQRGFDLDDARARVASQISRQDRRAIADWVIDNSGSPAELEAAIDAAFAWASALPAASPPTDAPTDAPEENRTDA